MNPANAPVPIGTCCLTCVAAAVGAGKPRTGAENPGDANPGVIGIVKLGVIGVVKPGALLPPAEDQSIGAPACTRGGCDMLLFMLLLGELAGIMGVKEPNPVSGLAAGVLQLNAGVSGFRCG